jgi:microcystin-dependent protein
MEYIGQITIFPFDFEPREWAFCDGRLLPISQHTGLFSLIGTKFGGDGRTNFGLPDYRGMAPNGSSYFIRLTTGAPITS